MPSVAQWGACRAFDCMRRGLVKGGYVGSHGPASCTGFELGWVGVEGKVGGIDEDVSPILARLDIDVTVWARSVAVETFEHEVPRSGAEARGA
jgi:hypothetical protein